MSQQPKPDDKEIDRETTRLLLDFLRARVAAGDQQAKALLQRINNFWKNCQ